MKLYGFGMQICEAMQNNFKEASDKIPIPVSMFLHTEILENCRECIKKMSKEKSAFRMVDMG